MQQRLWPQWSYLRFSHCSPRQLPGVSWGLYLHSLVQLSLDVSQWLWLCPLRAYLKVWILFWLSCLFSWVRLPECSSNSELLIIPRSSWTNGVAGIAGSNPSLTAAVVVLTGLVGANFTQLVMDKFGFSDPISRGMATASRFFYLHPSLHIFVDLTHCSALQVQCRTNLWDNSVSQYIYL